MAKNEVTGIKGVKKKLDKLAQDMPRAVAAAIWQGGQDIMRQAVQRTPVDTGNLRRTHVVDAPKMQGGISVKLGYSARYAIYVHERVELSHNVGEAKFLEKALDAEASVFGAKVAKRAAKIVERGSVRLPSADKGGQFDQSEWGE